MIVPATPNRRLGKPWQTAYRDTNFDVVELRELRDQKNLGRQVREYPERFSMLTPKAHLKAWLSFADKDEFRDQALAGARKLDHRTSDAVEMLNDKYDIAAPWQVLKYLPVLDLEMTAPLCQAALNQIARRHRQGLSAESRRPAAL